MPLVCFGADAIVIGWDSFVPMQWIRFNVTATLGARRFCILGR